MKTMIALVGGQPLPNFIPVRTEKPDQVLFVYTDRTEQTYKKLEAVLKQDGVSVYPLCTSAYDVTDIEHKLKRWIAEQKLTADQLIFNFTGGTKAMSLAMYRVAEAYQSPLVYLESEGKCSRLYRYEWNEGFHSTSTNLLRECITLTDFFNLYLGTNKWDKKGPSKKEGGNLEQAIADALKQAGYEVMCGVHTMNDQIDIDVAVRYENQVGIIEAKWGGSGRKIDAIKQLNNAAKQLSLYTKPISVVVVEPEERHYELREASGIRLVRLYEYTDLSATTLSPSDTELLLDAVANMLKG